LFSRIFLYVCLGASAVLAQQSVSGFVQDPAGGAVRAASVVITHLDRNQTNRFQSDGRGQFHFPSLPVGAYEMRVEAAGFGPVVSRFSLTVGTALEIPVTLAIASVDSQLAVTETVPVIETARTGTAQTVLPREVDSLPLNGRNYLDLALLVPGVSRTNTGAAQRFAETSAVPGTGISVAGQRNLNNNFVVDGMSANDDAAELAGTFFSQEVIREFQVVTSGGLAEFGRASSGILNITTKSGTNNLHGRAYGFLRNQRFDARNALAITKDPLTQTQEGASLSGPVRRDRTFLFTNFEKSNQNRVGILTIAPANVLAINQVLQNIGYRGPLTTTGEFPTGYATSNFFVRADHSLNDSSRIALRYSLYKVISTNARGVGGLNAVSRGSSLDNLDQTVAVTHEMTLSPQLFNSLHGAFTRSRLGAPINDSVGPAITVSGIASLGTATGSPLRRDTDMYELVDSAIWELGAHSLKAGAEFLENRVNILFPGAAQGVYSFSTLANLQAGRYTTFQQAFGAPSQFQANPNVGMFVQDQWRAKPGLTVNIGLRYDLQFLPSPIATDLTNVAPRLGIAWAPGNRKTVFRTSFGLYFDRTPLRATSNALQRDGSKYRVALLSFGQAGAPLFPAITQSFSSGQYIGITTIDHHIRNGYSEQASFEVERELGRDSSVTVGFQHLRGLHLILSRNRNVPTLTSADAAAQGIPNLGRPDPRYGNISYYEGSGDSYYNGLLVSARKRAGRYAELRFSYSYSKTIDDVGNFFFSSPQNNFNLRDDRGLSDNDQRHRVTASGVLTWAGIQLAPIVSYTSPLPFNVQTGTDRNFDTNVNDRPVGVGRNTGRGFNSFSVDLRLSRTFHVGERWTVEPLAEIFNTTNRTNLQLPNNSLTAGPAFGRATASGDARQLQFGLRVTH